jgi:hypothetical protein
LWRTTWFRAAFKDITDHVYGITYIDLAVTVGVSRLKGIRGGAALENITDKKDCIADIDLLIGIGVAANINIADIANTITVRSS